MQGLRVSWPLSCNVQVKVSYLILTGLPSIFFFALLVLYQFGQSRLVLLLLLLLFWMYLALEMNKLLTLLKYVKILFYDLHQIKSNFLRKLFLFLAWLKNNSNDLGEKACLVHKINWSRYNKCQRLFFYNIVLKYMYSTVNFLYIWYQKSSTDFEDVQPGFCVHFIAMHLGFLCWISI